MKFTTISHACLYIEHLDVRLLIDPWIIGSCYWRSWWNFPKVTKELIDYINPTHIYLTHLHWDHFHGPSLRLFYDKNPTILLPKHFNTKQYNDCINDFRFNNIKELTHGRSFSLGKDFKITSYQFNPLIIDSSIVIESDGITLLNSNDSKVFGFSLKHIINNHKKIDFAFRSHSSASPIPQCIRGKNPEKTDRSPLNYAHDFLAFGKASGAKYSVPFASSHIYLHDLSRKFNKFYSNPQFVKDIFDKKIKNSQKCVLMPSGSSWSKKEGFKLKSYNYSYLRKDINKYYQENREKLEKQISLSKKIRLNQKSFHNYFKKFLLASNYPFKLLNFKFGFVIEELKTGIIYLCIVNSNNQHTEIINLNSEKELDGYNLSFVIKTPIYVFNDCNSKIMHNSFTPSKLLEIIILDKNGEKNVSRYLGIIDFYENNCLPLKNLLSLRNLKIMLRRYRELFDILVYIYKIKFLKLEIHRLYSKI